MNKVKLNNYIKFLFSLLVIVIIITKSNDSFSQDASNGKQIFEKRCYYCHGLEGAGDGPVVPRLDPKPRNFRDAHFKFRTTPFNTLPTEEDLFRTITKGVPGTAMPFFSSLLSDSERRDVIAYIKTFNERWSSEGPGTPLKVGSAPATTPETLKHGEEVFKKAKCFVCHGEDGRGNGPITNTMRNEWGFQYKARNFTKGWLFKRGNTVEDIFTTISTGLNGTPMGSFVNLLTEEERWHVAQFVKSLNRNPQPVTISGGSIMVQSILIEDELLPTDPNDPKWESISIPTEIATGPQLMVVPRQWVPSVTSITVRSLFNKTDIAFLLEWDDRTGAQVDTFRDAIALQFPVKVKEGSAKPHFAMGAMGGAVNIWYWKSEFKPELQTVGFQNLEEIIGGTSFTEMNAKGFKAPPSVQPIESQIVKGNSIWNKGKWKVVMTRPLVTDDKKDIQFQTNTNIPIAFASWDGGNNDLGGRHNVAPWYYLILLTPQSNAIYLYIALAIIMAVGGEMWFVARLKRKLGNNDNGFLNFKDKGY